MRPKWAVVVLAVLFILGTTCVAVAQEEELPADVKGLVDQGVIGKRAPDELKGMIDEGKAGIILDVRPGEAFQGGHLPGATSIPRRTLEADIAKVVSDQAAPVCVYGATGVAGAAEAARLYNLGYKSVRYLDGGLPAWVDAGYAIEQ